jgi:hypothetical protein
VKRRTIFQSGWLNNQLQVYLVALEPTALIQIYEAFPEPPQETQVKQGVCHTAALPFTLKSSLMQKKNYENSNISPLKNIIFKKSSKRSQNPSRYYNSITNLKFQHKPKYHLSKILIQK